MYTDTQEAIRVSLWNFMGSLLDASMHEENKKKESVTALMSEELCKFCRDKDNKINMKAAKPVLKSAVWILEARKLEISSLPVKSEAIDSTVKDLDDLIASLNNYIDKI